MTINGISGFTSPGTNKLSSPNIYDFVEVANAMNPVNNIPKESAQTYNIKSVGNIDSVTQKSPSVAISPQQDKWTVSSAYQQYLSTSATGSSASQARIRELTEQLRQDTSFSQYKRRNFINHPVGRELASEIILADEGLQEIIAKTMWETLSWTAHQRGLPPSW